MKTLELIDFQYHIIIITTLSVSTLIMLDKFKNTKQHLEFDCEYADVNQGLKLLGRDMYPKKVA